MLKKFSVENFKGFQDFVWWPSNDIWCRFFVSGEKEWISLVP